METCRLGAPLTNANGRAITGARCPVCGYSVFLKTTPIGLVLHPHVPQAGSGSIAAPLNTYVRERCQGSDLLVMSHAQHCAPCKRYMLTPKHFCAQHQHCIWCCEAPCPNSAASVGNPA